MIIYLFMYLFNLFYIAAFLGTKKWFKLVSILLIF